ncbi:GGDEF domain-containing protein [Oceanobacillus bengalensis]|uniref:GGDEF domain-containing protein n=1 Tax=Oceanobacillus bengalensis TaxID=1435466 RepID=A0A494YSY7_9BACI|nr:GGDEF domain-containing protein [Oceanobacillus bengalensis]RKQ13241.1 GGDEF domain-containing protein [Oceanobacillus bengalensis]
MKELFRVRLFIIMIVFATVIAFTIAIINEQRITNELLENNKFQIEQIEDTVKYSLETIDKVYYYFDDDTAANMERNSKFLIDLYEDNPSFTEWDFNSLKEQLGMDIYIINNNNVVTHSSLVSDIGMDFEECCHTLAGILDERRSTGEFYHDGMDIAQDTGEITKFSYMATPDKEHLIELSYNLQDGEIFGEFNFLQVMGELEEKYPSINEINILNLGGLSLGESANEWKLTAERRQAFEKALNTDETIEVKVDLNDSQLSYRYVPYRSKYDSGSTQDKVIEIVHSNNQLQVVLVKNQRIFIIQLILVLIVTIILSLITSKWFARPVHMAFHDKLTGLKNRAAFEEDLQRQLDKNEGSIALLMFDLDNFKLVNDHLGYDQGDQLLQLVGSSVEASLPKGKTIYRLGGDEFTIIMPSSNRDDAEQIAELIMSNLNEVIKQMTELKGLHVTVSLGIAIAPDDGVDLESLYKKADIAMYKSKELGKNQYFVYQ